MIDQLERRFGRFAIPNITMILIFGQVMAFVAHMINPMALDRLPLIPSKVLDGEVTRLVTFVFMPPGDSPIWAFLFWYVFHLMGTALEGYWGTFRYNVFLLIGFVATIFASFLTPDVPASNGFVEGTVFLAFAYLNPTFEFLVFFILPVQVRWFAGLTWIGYGFLMIFGDWSMRTQLAASVLNFFVFFGKDIAARVVYGQRSMRRKARRFAEKEPDFFHKCTVCGVTDADAPDMDFRYCSQCVGEYAYCENHLRDHQHFITED